ncbi:C-Jun-amino-terminal kinase-interacting protein 1 [Bulinus truncatus]|nr:C-Jun-amino-terminal kinase-interacting protein 1 [Bulinus truncatus]
MYHVCFVGLPIGVNLRTGEKGIFPAMYANDLNFLEESDDEEEYWKFSMKFLGSVEVSSHKGDETLIQAINRVAMAQKDKLNTASLSTLEINQYGIRMIDKSKEGHQKDAFSHFFALKNISFCGTHPKNNRYFAFITKHPREYKFACHVFYGDRPTHRARDALGEAFKRFYQEYMAFTHPTEDIYME